MVETYTWPPLQCSRLYQDPRELSSEWLHRHGDISLWYRRDFFHMQLISRGSIPTCLPFGGLGKRHQSHVKTNRAKKKRKKHISASGRVLEATTTHETPRSTPGRGHASRAPRGSCAHIQAAAHRPGVTWELSQAKLGAYLRHIAPMTLQVEHLVLSPKQEDPRMLTPE